MSTLTPVVDLKLLLRDMDPQLHPGVYAFASCGSSFLPNLPGGLERSDRDSKTVSSTGNVAAEATTLDAILPDGVIAAFRESEGLSIVMEESAASAAGLDILLRTAWITLRVNSSLEAVGLTAAVSTALTDAGIPCNIVAAALHDHLFVPVEMAERTIAVLKVLQKSAA